MINFISFTECPVDVVSGDKVYKFIYPRLQSSDVFRLDFSVKGTRDASITLSEFTNEISYYLAGKIYLRIGFGYFFMLDTKHNVCRSTLNLHGLKIGQGIFK